MVNQPPKIQVNMKVITFFIPILLVLSSIGNLSAQVKYEYARISFDPFASKELIITDEKGYREIDVLKSDYQSVKDLTPLFNLIKKMEDEGWELFDTEGSGFFMRKKRD